MDMNAIVKLAMVQTIADTAELLLALQQVPGTEPHHQKIEEMVQRLTTMAKAV